LGLPPKRTISICYHQRRPAPSPGLGLRAALAWRFCRSGTQDLRPRVSATTSLLIDSALDVERIRAFRLEHAGQPPPAPCSPFADAKRRDDDIGDAAILFERRGMADERDGLALHFVDATDQIAAERTVGGDLRRVAIHAGGLSTEAGRTGPRQAPRPPIS
jgi:hypothetical protein